MRTFALLSSLLVFALAGAPSARACSCVPPPPPAEALSQSTAVFIGTAVDVRLEETGEGNVYVVRLRVDQPLKGVAGDEVTIRTPESSAACGYYFRPEKQYLVYAHAVSGQLHVSLCSRTARLADAREDLRALGLDDPEGSDLVGTTGGVCGGPGNMAALQALVFVVLGLLVVRRR